MRLLPPLGTLRAFEATARLLSFRRAAEELGVTPTAISHQVHLLEAHCGERLFRRRPRPITLTEAGRRLFPVLRDGFDAFAAAFTSFGVANTMRPLRITTTNAFAARWLIPRLSDWRATHADVAWSVIGTDRIVHLDAGEADLAFRYTRTAPEGAAPEILRDRFFPVCSPSLLAGRAPIRCVGDLAAYPLIGFDWFSDDPQAPTWTRWLAHAALRDPTARAVGRIALSFAEEPHAIEAVLAGHGIAICSDVVVADDLASGALVKVIDLPLPGYGFYPVYPPAHARRDVIETFLAWLRATARGE